MRLAFDIEGDDLLDKATTVHCIVAQDLDEGDQYAFGPTELDAGLRFLSRAAELWGHNIVDYDLPLLRRLHGFEYTGLVFDTLRASRQAYPGNELAKRDFILVRRGQMPAKVQTKPHSLEAWGYRFIMPKGEHTDFSVFTPAMLAYCQQDVRLLVRLIQHLLKRTTREIISIETRVAEILFEQSQTGVGFDEAKAAALSGRLAGRREEITRELRVLFKPWYVKDGKAKVSKVNNSKRGLTKGCEYQNVKLVEFNPASGEHIARVLQRTRGWKPHDFTDGGIPKTEEKILADLPWDECKLMVEFQKIKKLLGYISEGEMAWLRLVRDGRIHGRVHATGTVTNRMSHVEPNLGQVPKVGKYLGRECRQLFVAADGFVLVGADASGLQLRVMAHYLAAYDGGAFARVVENPEEDVHLYMQTDTGMFIRDNKKTSNYAWLFGAGDYKMGTIAILDMQMAAEAGVFLGTVPKLGQAVRVGRRVKQGLVSKLRMEQMNANLKRAAERGFLKSFDGREIPVLSQHKALNTLLMGGEAVLVKHWLLRLHPRLTPDAHMVLCVHDEVQIECLPETAETNGQMLVQTLRETGEAFGLRVKLDGKYKIGRTWADTH